MTEKVRFKVPFNEKEMNYEDRYPGFAPDVPGIPVYKTPIPPYQNLKLFLDNENPLWMPSFLEFKMFNPSVMADNVARAMVNEEGSTFPDKKISTDYFGIEWEFVPNVMGSIVRPGTPKVPDISEWEKYISFPDPDDFAWYDSQIKNREYLNDSRAIQMAVFTGFFERLISFTDMKDALIALIDEDLKPHVHRLFSRLCDFYDQLFYNMAKWYNPDLLWFHDDWGSQRAPLFSFETCNEMIVPYLKRVVDSAHSYGIGFEFHCCGKVESLVPAMIEAGVDMWAGQEMNDKAMLYKKYGSDIKLGVDLPAFNKDISSSQADEIVSEFLDTYPKNCYVGMSFGFDDRFYEKIYRQSRIKYNS